MHELPLTPTGEGKIPFETDSVSVLRDGSIASQDNNSVSYEHSKTDLRKTLEEHHVNMIAFSACIGFGLFLQNGRVIYLAGPGLAILAYFLMGTIMWSCTASLGEMTALFPVKGPIFEFPRRFLDESLGFATGWLTWFSWAVLTASELVAITHLMSFRFLPQRLEDAGYPQATLQWPWYNTNSAVWVSLFLIIMLCVNLLPVRLFGQIEYVLGSIKLCFIVALILFNVAISIKKPVPRASQFWTYDSPYSGAAPNITLPDGHTVITGAAGRLGAMWEGMTTAIFGMIGFETISLTAAENKDLRKEETVKIGTRKISLRIITLYVLATFAVGLNVPYTDENIRDNSIIGVANGQNSAFVVAAMLNHFRAWPHVFNAFFVFSAATCGVNSLYNASRILHAMASVQSAWPDWAPIQSFRVRLERTKGGVPYTAVIVSWLFSFIAFSARVNNPNSSKVLGRLVRCVVISTLLVYAVACVSYLQFFRCIKRASSGDDEALDNDPAAAQTYDRNHHQYPYKSRGQYLRAYYGLVGCLLMIFFNGWRAFVHPISWPDVVASYISIFILACFTIAYQIKRNGFNPQNWRRRASKELRNPVPVVVLSKRRRGVLTMVDKDVFFTRGNAGRLFEWIWLWMR